MTRRGLAIASVLVVVAMLAVALLVAGSLPDDVRLPAHWGADGKPGRFTDKWSALLMPAAIAAAMSALFFWLPSLEPREQGLERSRGLYLGSWAAMLLVFAVIQLVIVSAALGWGIPGSRLLMASVGVLLAIVGNQLGKSRSMYLVGIRTPWTLASEDVWIKTHRLGGKLMVGAGLAVLVAAMLPLPPEVLTTILLASVAVAVIVPTAYSFLLWRQERRAGTDRLDQA